MRRATALGSVSRGKLRFSVLTIAVLLATPGAGAASAAAASVVRSAGSDPGAWTALTAGGAHTCGLEADGTAWCWGNNLSGQVGDGSTELRTSPVRVVSATR